MLWGLVQGAMLVHSHDMQWEREACCWGGGVQQADPSSLAETGVGRRGEGEVWACWGSRVDVGSCLGAHKESACSGPC